MKNLTLLAAVLSASALISDFALAQNGLILLNDPAVSNPSPEKPKQVHQCRPGPWGELEYHFTFLEAPDSLVELMSVPSQQPVWRFMNKTAEEVKSVIRESGLSDALQSELIERSIWYHDEGEIRVHPRAELIPAIPTPARRVIYAELRRWDENPFHRAPVVIESGNVRQFFEGAGLSEPVLVAIEQVAYPLGGSLCFSDVAWVLGKVATDAEERRFLKALTRTRSLILRLRVTPESDIRELSEYWTAGFKHKDVLPILESILRTRGVDHLDVVHLLPPTPRKHLYTFPPLSAGLSGKFPDCFWTSLNFFEFWPKDRFHDEAAAVAHIRQEYGPVEPPYGFGDLVLLSNPETGRTFHSFVYIADDIVYTKNGQNLLRPWILVKQEDLLARYRTGGELTIGGWRRKKGSGVPGIPTSAPAP